MTLIDELLQELEQEAGTTRRVLERVPNDQLTWRPHEKSMTLGQLARHIAVIPGNLAEAATQPSFEPRFTEPPQPESVQEVLTLLDESIAKARKILPTFDQAMLEATWRLVRGEQVILAIPRKNLVRSIMLNHWYHHRGQLTVYLRLVGAVVPTVYGPSADENPFLAKENAQGASR